MPPAPIPAPRLTDGAGLRVGAGPDPVLAAFALSRRPNAAGDLPWLGGPPGDERWACADPQAFRFEQLQIAVADDMAAAAAQAYGALLQRVRGSAQPYLLRIWNFFPAINRGSGDGEMYRQFCVGRAAAVDAEFHQPPPAATAIGQPDGSGLLELIALCGRRPGLALENPRQTPAWQYPREYGPVSPGFSRGVVLGEAADAVLLASGTASIVGHVSRHPGNLEAQLAESLANLESLLAEGERRSGSRFPLQRCQALRVYLRHPEHLAPARAQLNAVFGGCCEVRYLHGDICRRELLVELEGVFASG